MHTCRSKRTAFMNWFPPGRWLSEQAPLPAEQSHQLKKHTVNTVVETETGVCVYSAKILFTLNFHPGHSFHSHDFKYLDDPHNPCLASVSLESKSEWNPNPLLHIKIYISFRFSNKNQNPLPILPQTTNTYSTFLRFLFF